MAPPPKVRNEESRARLPPALRNCLVLTVEEAKGLEFDDAEQRMVWVCLKIGILFEVGFYTCRVGFDMI